MTTDNRDPTIVAAGRAAQVAGKHLNDSPYVLGSAEWCAWRAGYMEGHAADVARGAAPVTARHFGQKARALGTPLSANPYNHGRGLWREWNEGWNGR